jgi:hypothetical protein
MVGNVTCILENKMRDDAIRKLLLADFDRPASEIVKAITKMKLYCTTQHVYSMRSRMRKATVGNVVAPQQNELIALREAVISFAKARGIENPDKFPQRLVDTFDQYKRAEQVVADLIK